MNRCSGAPVLLLILALFQAGCSAWTVPHARLASPVATGTARGSAPTYADAVHEARMLLTLTHQGAVTELVLFAEVNWALTRIHQRQPELTHAELRLIGQVMMQDLRKAVERPSGLLDQEAALYARYYTAAELREMIAFFRRPAGQSMLLESPQLDRDLEQMQRRWAAGIAGDVFSDVRARMDRAGYPDVLGH